MKVVIPLAGKGTRLRPHTYVTPKPLLNVGGRPVMSYILDDLKELGVTEVVFITGHLGDKVQEYVAREYPEFTAHYIEQETQDGTAGAVGLAREFIDEDVLILFVDTIFDTDLSVIRDLPDDVAGVIWVKEVEDYQRFGVVLTDKDGFMKRIIEKPQDPVSKLANIGLYYIRDWKLLFEGIADVMKSTKSAGQEYYLTDAFQYMIDRGSKIRTIEVEGWYDAGKPDTLLETNRHLLENGGQGRAPDGGHNVKVHEPVRVEEGVTLEDCEIGPNVTLMSGASVKGSRIRDSIVGAGTRIEDSELHDCLIGESCVVSGVQGSMSIADHSEIVR
ncbi:MAG TPA: sugar phosphate nucleotidyltransferase [Thermoanaerobaculia bacterium]